MTTSVNEQNYQLLYDRVMAAFASKSTPVEWSQPKIKKGANAHIASVIFSDFHVGEKVIPAEVYNLNNYNLDVAENRIENLGRITNSLCFEKSNIKIDGLIINMLGDMISGDIHDELRETNELSPIDCVLWLKNRLISLINYLLDKFKKVHINFVCGNHGKDKPGKPPSKRYVHKNWDYLLYMLLADHFHGKHEGFSFSFNESNEIIHTVHNINYLCVHGDQLGVKGGDGIIGSMGVITRGAMKTIQTYQRQHIDVDCVLMGHWHELRFSSLSDNFIGNGSLIGYNEWAKTNKYRPAPAMQALWLTHPEHGIITNWPILLQDNFTLQISKLRNKGKRHV